MDIAILGPLVLRHAGRQIEVSGPRARALVAALVLARGHPLSAERIAHLLWTDEPPDNPANAVQAQVSRLRRALRTADAGDRLVTTPAGYTLSVTAEEVDAWRFDALVADAGAAVDRGEAHMAAATAGEALALWRGAVLADAGDAPLIVAERRRMEDQHALACERLASARLALGRDDEAIDHLREAVARHRTHERLHALLMTALYRTGRATEALDVYQELRARLAELGLEPGPELSELQVGVLTHDVEAAGRSSAAGTRSHIPASTFVGRDDELTQVRELVAAHRLVTLLGPGGCGKTRLDLEAAARLGDHFADGAVVVELAAVTEPGAVASTIVGALRPQQPLDLRGVAAPAMTDPLAQARAVLRDRSCLLVLDNCEHVIDAAAYAVDDLVRSCPQLVVLVTSREALHVHGERLLTVAPLRVPPTTDIAAAEVAAYPAVRLFLDRAQAIVPSLELDETNASTIAIICRRLDGLPLALELAAARVRMLGLDDIAARLDDRFRLLTGGARTALPRQRTLEAVVEWSYDLLDDDERWAWLCLAVFAGGAEVDAAEAVCGDGTHADVLDVLAALVDKSLVTVETDDGSRRFVLLETLRDFGRRRLAASGRASEARDAHARWFADLADRADAGLRGPEQVGWLDRLERERDNLDAAFAWLLRADTDGALAMAGALAWWSAMRGEPGPGAERLATALDGASPSADRATALAWLALLTGFSGDATTWDRATAAAEEAVTLAGDRRDRPAGLAYVIAGYLAGIAGDTRKAARQLDRAEAVAVAAADRWARAVIGFLRCLLRLDGCDLDTTLVAFEEAGDGWGIVQTLGARADMAVSRGDLAGAAEDLERAADLAGDRGLHELSLTMRAQLANLWMLRGDHHRARRLHGAVLEQTARERVDLVAGISHNGLGMLARREGDLTTAERHHRAALARYEDPDGSGGPNNAGKSLSLCHLAFCAIERGDAPTARGLLARARPYALRSTDPRDRALLAEALAATDVLEGDPVTASRRLGWATHVRAALHSPLPREDRRDVDRIEHDARRALGDGAVDAALADGATLDEATAIGA